MDIIKEKYDYYYNYFDVPKVVSRVVLWKEKVVTVCYLVIKNNNIGRGISVCSEQDEFNKEIGQTLAKHNAIRALKHRSVPLIKRKEAVKQLIRVKCPFIKKGELNPVLSWWERNFLFGKKGMYDDKKVHPCIMVDLILNSPRCRCLSIPVDCRRGNEINLGGIEK